MAIEKRFHQRIDIETDVDIHILHHNRHILAKAENVTPYGMLLRIDKLTVPTGMLLELSLDIDQYLRTVPGLVIWADRQKIGIMFPQIQPTLFTAAEALIGKDKGPIAGSHRISAKYMLFQPEPHTST